MKAIDSILIKLNILKDSRNLLAFSGGVDSTCLFFLLLENDIDFDIAIVNYGVRKEAKKEIKYAKKLAKKYNKHIFILDAPKIKSNFENNARQIRYEFFERIILTYNYDTLLLAHQLNDRLEWFLMQLTKGCGLNSLLGFREVCLSQMHFLKQSTQILTQDSPKIYRVVRPLSETSRDEILAFLKKRKIKFFIDKSNKNLSFKRNYFRKHFSNKLIKNFQSGIINSLRYLNDDFLALYGKSEIIYIEHIAMFRRVLGDENLVNLQNLAKIDNAAKYFGYVISKKQRDEILKSQISCILGDKIIIDSNESHIFITTNDAKNSHNANFSPLKHSKNMRDKLRIAKIPPKIRPFVDEKLLKSILTSQKAKGR